MSLVVFPFKDEPPDLVATNVETALRHERIDEVWGVAGSDDGIPPSLQQAASALSSTYSKPVRLMLQERIGRLRPGKGDAMNTAIREAAGQGRRRVHFYDSDITNFDGSWIEGAELAADNGYGVVRHRFPRAATDAMITWFITRPGLATLFPGSLLPRLDQPLGGEFLVTEPALAALAASPTVRLRSDWGIDTMITYESAILGLGLYEHHVADGKRHALYGSLAELTHMALECLDAICSLQGRHPPPSGARHATDPSAPVPSDLKEVTAYDPTSSSALLASPLSPSEQSLGATLPLPVDEASRDERSWQSTLVHLIHNFEIDDPDWRNLAFRLWVARVLAYTRDVVPRGFDRAIAYLEQSISEFEAAALIRGRSGQAQAG